MPDQSYKHIFTDRPFSPSALYFAFYQPKPSSYDDKIRNYEALMYRITYDKPLQFFLDTEDDIHVQLRGASVMATKIKRALDKINEEQKYSITENENEFIFPAQILQNRENMAIFLNELAENKEEVSLLQKVAKTASDNKDKNVARNVFIGATAAILLTATALAITSFLGPVFVGIIAGLCIASAAAAGVNLIKNNKRTNNMMEDIEKNSGVKLKQELENNMKNIQTKNTYSHGREEKWKNFVENKKKTELQKKMHR